MTHQHPVVTAIVLAAGLSRRMGTSKPLLPFAGVSVVETIVARLNASRVQRVIVVVGHLGEQVASRLRGLPVECVRNPAYRHGMLSSVRVGVQYACAGTVPDALLIVLGDQPLLATPVVDTLITRYAQLPPGAILVPVCQGQRGHPLLFSSSYAPEVLTDFEATGLRGLLAKHAEHVREVPTVDDSVLINMNTLGDYTTILQRARDMSRDRS